MSRRAPRNRWLMFVPVSTGALLLVPIAAGLAGTALPALLVTHDETDANAAGGPVVMLRAAA